MAADKHDTLAGLSESFSAPELGPRRRGTCPGHQVRRGWPAWAGMAFIHPLPGPDAKTPAFPNIFFLTNAVVCPRSQGRTPQAEERREMDYGSTSEDASTPPIYECALAELLAAGLGADVRPLLQAGVSPGVHGRARSSC